MCGFAAADGPEVASTRHLYLLSQARGQGPRTVQRTTGASALNGDKITAADQRPADPRTHGLCFVSPIPSPSFWMLWLLRFGGIAS